MILQMQKTAAVSDFTEYFTTVFDLSRYDEVGKNGNFWLLKQTEKLLSMKRQTLEGVAKSQEKQLLQQCWR